MIATQKKGIHESLIVAIILREVCAFFPFKKLNSLIPVPLSEISFARLNARN